MNIDEFQAVRSLTDEQEAKIEGLMNRDTLSDLDYIVYEPHDLPKGYVLVKIRRMVIGISPEGLGST